MLVLKHLDLIWYNARLKILLDNTKRTFTKTIYKKKELNKIFNIGMIIQENKSYIWLE